MGRAANFEAIQNMNLVRVTICFQLCSMVWLHREGGKYYNFQTQKWPRGCHCPSMRWKHHFHVFSVWSRAPSTAVQPIKSSQKYPDSTIYLQQYNYMLMAQAAQCRGIDGMQPTSRHEADCALMEGSGGLVYGRDIKGCILSQ